MNNGKGLLEKKKALFNFAGMVNRKCQILITLWFDLSIEEFNIQDGDVEGIQRMNILRRSMSD